MRFIVDVMLGSLAKWLRILGHDTLYNPSFSDDELFFKAHLENRVLLTRDKELAARVREDLCLYIQSKKLKDQLKQVFTCFPNFSEENIFTRCVLCNNLVKPVPKNEVRGRVPEYVFNSVEIFYYCNKCDKIYWEGSHIEHVKSFLIELRRSQHAER